MLALFLLPFFVMDTLRTNAPSTHKETLHELFTTHIRPGYVLVTGGSGAGKSTFFEHMRPYLPLVPNSYFNDALFLERTAKAEHGPDGTGLSLCHIHPESIHEELGVELVHDVQGKLLGHRHHGIDMSRIHFPFEVSNSLLNNHRFRIPDFVQGNPIIVHTYQQFFRALLEETLPEQHYLYTELAGGINNLSKHQPDHHMSSVDVSYQHLWTILEHTAREEGKDISDIRARISCIINIQASDKDRLCNTATRTSPEEARTNVLIDVFGTNDAKEAFAEPLQVPYLEIYNTHLPSIAAQQASFQQQLITALSSL